MKAKILITGMAAIATLASEAQTQPPNGNFDTWVNLNFNLEEPQSWGTPNQTGQGPQFPAIATKETDAISGFALRLENKVFNMNGDTIPGIALLNGTFQMAQPPKGGLPYTDRPDSMTAWIKGNPQGGDIASVQSLLTKWNGNTRDTIAMADYSFTTPIASYTRISIPFSYNYPDNPDTLHVIIRAGMHGNLANPGSYLYIDDFGFANTVGINEYDRNRLPIIYPNPNHGSFTMKLLWDNTENILIKIFDMYGKTVYEDHADIARGDYYRQFHFNKLPAGMYMLSVTTKQQNIIQKITISK